VRSFYEIALMVQIQSPRHRDCWPLALRFEQLMLADGIAAYAELARLGHVSRARITQIMNLLLLAPDIQEALLFLPPTVQGRDPLHLLDEDVVREKVRGLDFALGCNPQTARSPHARGQPISSRWVNSSYRGSSTCNV
jgi:hypothetical protein